MNVLFTGTCQQITYMVKQLNYARLTAEITVYQLQNKSSTLIVFRVCYSFYHICWLSFIVTSEPKAVYSFINTLIDI